MSNNGIPSQTAENRSSPQLRQVSNSFYENDANKTESIHTGEFSMAGRSENVNRNHEKNFLPIHKKIYEKLNCFLKNNKVPHIIFHGSSGTGKKTIVNHFINDIYLNDKLKIKKNVMFVNCAHGKGIKFIRDELKFFAKTNIYISKTNEEQSGKLEETTGVLFKTIVLLNADYLTIDAQSALRRCIELFSYNTRFFIIVENKEKLLCPILSRFCEIHVPEIKTEIKNIHFSSQDSFLEIQCKKFDNKEHINLHQYDLNNNYIEYKKQKRVFLREYLKDIYTYLQDKKYSCCSYFMEDESSPPSSESIDTLESNADNFPSLRSGESLKFSQKELLKLTNGLYDQGFSCLDVVYLIENDNMIKNDFHKLKLLIKFYEIKNEYRSEKLLMFYIFNTIIHPEMLDESLEFSRERHDEFVNMSLLKKSFL
jgi:DNA polymerase III delta prime subunit